MAVRNRTMEDDIAGDSQNQKGGDQCESDQRHPESRRIHKPAVGLFINVKDKKPQGKGKKYGKRHVQYGDSAYIFQKTGSEYILKSHKVLRSAAIPAASIRFPSA